MARCIIAVLPRFIPLIIRAGLNGLDQRGPVDAGALLVQQLLPEDDGPGVAAVQEVIGRRAASGRSPRLVPLERAIEQAQRLRVSCWPAW